METEEFSCKNYETFQDEGLLVDASGWRNTPVCYDTIKRIHCLYKKRGYIMIGDIHTLPCRYDPENRDMMTRTGLKIVGIDPEDQFGSPVRSTDELGTNITGILQRHDPDEVKKCSNRLFGISVVGTIPKLNIEKVECEIASLGWKTFQLVPRACAD